MYIEKNLTLLLPLSNLLCHGGLREKREEKVASNFGELELQENVRKEPSHHPGRPEFEHKKTSFQLPKSTIHRANSRQSVRMHPHLHTKDVEGNYVTRLLM